MSIDLEITKSKDSEFWNKLVEKSPYGSIFHKWEWLKIAEKHTDSKLFPLVGFKGTEPVSIYPLFFKKIKMVKAVFSPIPHAAIPYLGPVIINYDLLKEDKKLSTFNEFINVVENFIKNELNPHYTLLTLPTGFKDCRPFKWMGYTINPIFNYVLDLRKGKDQIWANLKRKLRGDIERTKRRGIYIEQGGKEDLIKIYNLLLNRYKEQNLKVGVTLDYLLEIYKKFYPENLRIFMAKHNGDPISGIITLISDKKVIFWIGAPKANYHGSSPNDLAQWEAISWACSRGIQFYEEIGAGTERLAIFKAKYNPKLEICFTVKKYFGLTSKVAEFIYQRLKIEI